MGNGHFAYITKLTKKKKKKKLPKRGVLKFFQSTKKEEKKFGNKYKIFVFEQFE